MGEIRGTYAKNGHITEIYLPNGITEIQCDNYNTVELHSFSWKSRPKETYRRYEGITLPNAILLGISCGLTCGSLLASAFMFADWPFRALLIGTLILDALIVAENLTKEVKR